MTTTEIASYADPSGLTVGASDLNLQVLLRRKVVPKWEMDVGKVAWRLKNATVSIVAGTQEYDLASNFFEMADESPIFVGTDDVQHVLTYLGDDPGAILRTEAALESTTPAGYWIVPLGSSPKQLRRLKLDASPVTAGTLYYAYYSKIPFADNSTPVELDDFMPDVLQWGLVEGLQAEVLRQRFSINDPRLPKAEEAYALYVSMALEYGYPGRQSKITKVSMGGL